MPNPETLRRVKQEATVVAELRRAVAAATEKLRDAIVAADRDGHGRNEIVRAAAGGLSRRMVYEIFGVADGELLAQRLDELLAAHGWRRGEDYLAYPTANGVRLLLGTELSEKRDATRLNAASALTNLLREAGYAFTLPNGQPDVDLYERLARPDGEILVIPRED